VPGLKELNAVDAAGVHPLLIAIGSERYTPYLPTKQPAELLTIANRMLGTGQLSLAKFLFITADEQNKLNTKDIQRYFEFVLERVHWDRDVHFYTKTTIDTLDYSGESLNSGSKVVIAAYGEIIRKLATEIPQNFQALTEKNKCRIAMPGVVVVQTNTFKNYQEIGEEIAVINAKIKIENTSDSSTNSEIALIVLCDDADFVSKNLNNFLWVTFTRCNPSHDIHGINAFVENKHWGCKGPLIIDARIKPHHAPPVIVDSKVEEKIEKHFKKGGALYQI
jgi:4-hydroxy-3-polyprenylbenzoate decarboxylase